MSQADAVVLATPLPLWRNYSFHILWAVTFAAGVGDRLIMNAALPMLGYAGKDVENAPITAGINFFFFLPYLFWSPFAGWLADRLPRKWLMFASDELRALIVLSAFTLLPNHVSTVPQDQQWKVWGLICAVGVMAATFVPAKMSCVPNVVGMALLGRANAMVISMGIIGNLMGFVVGGLLQEYLKDDSLKYMILTSSLCYGVSGIFWAFLKTPYTPRGESRAIGGPMKIVADIGQGMSYSWKHKPLRVLLLVNAVVWGGVAVYQPALAVVNVEVYHRDAAGYMFLMAPLGLGMLLASGIFGLLNPRLGNEILIVLGLVLCGVFIILQMIVPIFGLGFVIALFTGAGAGTIFVPLYTILQRGTADHIRGRVMGAKEIVGEFGQVVASFVIWRMAHADPLMRPAAIVVASGLIVLAIIGLWRYVFTGPTPSKALNFCWRFNRLLADAMHHLKVVGRHRVPRTGAVLLVSNHTAGIDPTLIQAAVPRKITWLMAKEYRLRGLGWFWRRMEPILVNRKAADPGAAKAAIERLRGGDILGVFPEGHINYESTGLKPLEPGVALIARRSNATIVPIHISGTPRNVEPMHSFLIPSHSRVEFGKPFRLTEEEASDRDKALEAIRKKMEEVAKTEKVTVA